MRQRLVKNVSSCQLAKLSLIPMQMVRVHRPGERICGGVTAPLPTIVRWLVTVAGRVRSTSCGQDLTSPTVIRHWSYAKRHGGISTLVRGTTGITVLQLAKPPAGTATFHNTPWDKYSTSVLYDD